MFRYVALAWNPSLPQQTEAARRVERRLRTLATGLHPVHRGPGLVVSCADIRPGSSEVQFLADGGGVVLGKLFRRDEEEEISDPLPGNGTAEKATVPFSGTVSGVAGVVAPPRVELNSDASAAILASGGRRLVERYWGRYVAFLRREMSRTTWVLRDPSGCLPCYLASHDGVDLWFSCIDDCIALGQRFTVNWKYVESFAAYPGLQVRDTGLNEVSEVQPGECIELHDGAAKKRKLYWDPVRIAQSTQIENVDAAAAALRGTTRACVAAWAACHPRIVLTLSGGLDSAIVLGCLRRMAARPQITCLNYFDASAEGDERPYARAAAEQAGCELIECDRDVSNARLDPVLRISRSPRPWYYMYYATHSPIETRVAQERGATALFGGGGGDQLFYNGDPQLAAADYVHRHGLGADLWRIAFAAASARHVSIWRVLRGALRDGFLQRRHSAHVGPEICRQLVNPDLVARACGDLQLTHPWLTDTQGMPPGKLRQLLSMSLAPAFYNPLGGADDPESVHPLISQPLVELALRIPTWVLGLGARNRGLARLAFAGDVPSTIIARRDKGGMTPFAVELLKRNTPFVRELLFEGQLARAGIIDRQRIERLLAGSYSSRTPGLVEIIDDFVSLEAWLRSWTEVRQGASAAA